jgi:hypothetical protein
MAVVLLLAWAGAAGFILAKNEPRVVEVKPEDEVAAGADDSMIAKGAKIDWIYEYGMCSHNIYLSCDADEDMVGLKFSEFQAEYPDVRIVSFEPDKLTLKMSFDCYCPRHYILRRHSNGLAVLRTILGTGEHEIFYEVPVRFEEINGDEKIVLEAGKLFDSIEEMEEYIKTLIYNHID